MKEIKTLVIDANQEFGASLQEYFSVVERLEFLGVMTDIETALVQIAKAQPDLVLLDSSFRESNISDVVARIRSACGTTKVCLLTVFEDKVYEEHAIRQNLDGVVPRLFFETKFAQLLDRLFGVPDQPS